MVPVLMALMVPVLGWLSQEDLPGPVSNFMWVLMFYVVTRIANN